jgi:hypothetical protein
MNVLLLVHMHSSFESVRKIAPDVAPDEDITPHGDEEDQHGHPNHPTNDGGVCLAMICVG